MPHSPRTERATSLRAIRLDSSDVLAILAAQKTLHLTPVLPQPPATRVMWRSDAASTSWDEVSPGTNSTPRQTHRTHHAPWGPPRQRLWVQEAFAAAAGSPAIAYQADGACGERLGLHGRAWSRHGIVPTPTIDRRIASRDVTHTLDAYGGRWRSAAQMNRPQSRLDLEVVRVSVERLSAIPREAARMAGYVPYSIEDGWRRTDVPATRQLQTALETRYPALFDDNNDDPWLWAIEFRRIG